MNLKPVSDVLKFELKYDQDHIGHSPRMRNIMQRKRLNSFDGAIIDEHDQFYRDHKLLLLLFRVSILHYKVYNSTISSDKGVFF